MRVLVAEDNAQWRSVIAGVLKTGQELVDFVERGDQVLEAAEKLRPELITLDVSMPGQSGLNVLPRLRTLLPNAIIVIVSATATPLYKEEAFDRGANGYVEKSRVLSDLLQTIASAREGGSEQGACKRATSENSFDSRSYLDAQSLSPLQSPLLS